VIRKALFASHDRADQARPIEHSVDVGLDVEVHPIIGHSSGVAQISAQSWRHAAASESSASHRMLDGADPSPPTRRPFARTNGRLSKPAYNSAVSRKNHAVDLRVRTRHTFVRGL
jgi:hypothetical protein